MVRRPESKVSSRIGQQGMKNTLWPSEIREKTAKTGYNSEMILSGILDFLR
jgi:hypothetical protein